MTTEEFDRIAKERTEAAQQAKKSNQATAPDRDDPHDTRDDFALMNGPWDILERALIDAGVSSKINKKERAGGIFRYLQANGGSGKTLPVEKRRELYSAIALGRFDYEAGTILHG